MRLKFDWFLTGMVAATALAWLFPGPGAAGGWLHPALLTNGAIALIFFLHGVALSFDALKAGALHWRLHVVVQAGTFLLFPLFGLALNAMLDGQVSPALRMGLFYLCALPSTVSSSVALTAAADGNVAGAVFNATLSSVLGIVLTPLWVTVVATTAGHGLPLRPVLIDLVEWLLLPLAIGQLCRPVLGAWAARKARIIDVIDRATILAIVYTSFCDSFAHNVWSQHGWTTLLIVLAVAGLLFAIMMAVMRVVTGMLGFARGDQIAAMFCGSKKTLAAGVPMARLIFGANPAIGVILLPIMVYHPLQLVLCSFLAQRWGREPR